MITEKSESMLSITKTPSSVIRDYKYNKLFLLFIIIFFTISLIIPKDDPKHIFTSGMIFFLLAFCIPIIWQTVKFKKQYKEGYTTIFNRTSELIYVNKDILYTFNDVSSVLVGPYYDADNTYTGHEIRLKVKNKSFTIESRLKEEADIRLAEVIAGFIDKPLIKVESF